MSSSVVNSEAPKPAPFSTVPDEITLHIFSFLSAGDLRVTACVSQTFKILSSLSLDFLVWKPKTEKSYWFLLSLGGKEPDKNWRQTYLEFQGSSF